MLSCHIECNFLDAQAHRLFDFIDGSGRSLTSPFFLEYTTGWFDDSTFVIEVINGTRPLQPGIVDSSWSEGLTSAQVPEQGACEFRRPC